MILQAKKVCTVDYNSTLDSERGSLETGGCTNDITG